MAITLEAPRQRHQDRTPGLIALGIVYVVLVLVATLAPMPWTASRVGEVPFGVLNPATWVSSLTWTEGSAGEFLLNVAMFIPIGLLSSRLLDPRMRIVVPVALTVVIEIAQLLLPDRVSDPRDLVANALGAIAGLAVARVVSRRREAARR